MLKNLFFLALIVGAFVAIGVFLSRWLLSRAQLFQSRETPLEIIKKRYATGEITRETFEQMKKDLE